MTVHLHFRLWPSHAPRAAHRAPTNCGTDGECRVCDFPFGDMPHACIGLSEQAPLANTA